jgi:phosphohistidine phosphatase
LKLILTRHAKSSWDDLSIDDHDRLLNDRGKAAADRMGTWLNEQDHIPAHVICSTAERAKWTCALMVEQITPRPKVSFASALYHASPDTIMAQIRRAPTGDLMVVGHNPGIASFANLICETQPKHERFSVYPTTATLIVELPVDSWAELKFGTARTLNFVVPRELKALM